MASSMISSVETITSPTISPARMTKRQLRKEARAMILSGHSRQRTFEELQGKAKNPQEEIATIVRFIPTLEARQQYKWAQSALIILLVLSVFFKLAAGLPLIMENPLTGLMFMLLFPIFNILLLYGVVTHRGEYYRFVAFWGILTLTRMIGDPIPDMAFFITDVIYASALIGLGFFLNKKLVPDFRTVKEKYTNAQGQPRMRNRIIFDATPMESTVN